VDAVFKDHEYLRGWQVRHMWGVGRHLRQPRSRLLGRSWVAFTPLGDTERSTRRAAAISGGGGRVQEQGVRTHRSGFLRTVST